MWHAALALRVPGGRSKMNRKLVLLGVCLTFAVSASVSATAGAASQPKIGPHQYFEGLVNGSIGAGRPAILKVVCPGPESRTGHPLAGQAVEVTEPKVIHSTSGYTGKSGR